MPLVIILAILMVLVASGGYYLGPGIGYYGAGIVCTLLLAMILYRVFASGPRRRGMPIPSQFEAPPEVSKRR
jgi:peptidoglycan/LPS O-acetylase OafA/YrhL